LPNGVCSLHLFVVAGGGVASSISVLVIGPDTIFFRGIIIIAVVTAAVVINVVIHR
jgi:hypothetical protein